HGSLATRSNAASRFLSAVANHLDGSCARRFHHTVGAARAGNRLGGMERRSVARKRPGLCALRIEEHRKPLARAVSRLSDPWIWRQYGLHFFGRHRNSAHLSDILAPDSGRTPRSPAHVQALNESVMNTNSATNDSRGQGSHPSRDFLERSLSRLTGILEESVFAEESASQAGWLQQMDPRVKT